MDGIIIVLIYCSQTFNSIFRSAFLFRRITLPFAYYGITSPDRFVTNGKYVIGITFRYQYDNFVARFINLAAITRLFFPHLPFRLFMATVSSVFTR